MARYVAGRSLLKERLKLAGKKQRDLVERYNVTRQRVSDWANNRRSIPIGIQKDMADFLGCSIDDLWEWQEVPRTRRKDRNE
ncbi:helix-turn-helix transcriptional regulator [Brevibacillus daliensis]|uniref:helix-turn-helix transcriptional regulator n=1 Tax=Brevibacillus daliensis TaxID=2892995 RepID=UPI001E654A9B|nr:helix-turn-helix transcriptional regulator [Brevibacillus daliensis]